MIAVAYASSWRRPPWLAGGADDHGEVPANTPVNALARTWWQATTRTWLRDQIPPIVSDIGGEMRLVSLVSLEPSAARGALLTPRPPGEQLTGDQREQTQHQDRDGGEREDPSESDWQAVCAAHGDRGFRLLCVGGAFPAGGDAFPAGIGCCGCCGCGAVA